MHDVSCERDAGGARSPRRWKDETLRTSPGPMTGRASDCQATRQPSGVNVSWLRALVMWGWGQPRWCSTTPTALYFETDVGDGFREPGYSKQRRLEPRITVGLLTDARGFPLMVEAFEGNKAETITIIPSIQAFQAAHRFAEVSVVADASMLSDSNLWVLSGAGLRFIVGQKIPGVP